MFLDRDSYNKKANELLSDPKRTKLLIEIQQEERELLVVILSVMPNIQFCNNCIKLLMNLYGLILNQITHSAINVVKYHILTDLFKKNNKLMIINFYYLYLFFHCLTFHL